LPFVLEPDLSHRSIELATDTILQSSYLSPLVLERLSVRDYKLDSKKRNEAGLIVHGKSPAINQDRALVKVE